MTSTPQDGHNTTTGGSETNVGWATTSQPDALGGSDSTMRGTAPPSGATTSAMNRNPILTEGSWGVPGAIERMRAASAWPYSRIELQRN